MIACFFNPNGSIVTLSHSCRGNCCIPMMRKSRDANQERCTNIIKAIPIRTRIVRFVLSTWQTKRMQTRALLFGKLIWKRFKSNGKLTWTRSKSNGKLTWKRLIGAKISWSCCTINRELDWMTSNNKSNKFAPRTQNKSTVRSKTPFPFLDAPSKQLTECDACGCSHCLACFPGSSPLVVEDNRPSLCLLENCKSRRTMYYNKRTRNADKRQQWDPP